MEEEVGFEPTERSHVRRFSRPLQSTALALLRAIVSDVLLYYQFKINCQEHFLNYLHDFKILSTCYSIAMENQSNIAIRKTSTLKLIVLSVITFGIWWYIWLWKLITDINNLYPQKGKCIHRYNWFCMLIGLDIISIILDLKGIQKEFIINIADILWAIINLILTLQILKNIERYVKEKFDIAITHNVFGWLFFGSFYVNYKINRLNISIQDGINRKITQMKLFKIEPLIISKIKQIFKI